MDQNKITVPTELFAVAESSSYAGELDLGELEVGPDVYRFAKPLRWNATVSNTGDALLVAGSIVGQGTTSCGRCLEDVPVDIEGVVQGYYLLHEPEEGELDDEEDDFEVLGEDNVIDMEPLLVSAVIVDLPLMPLCREDCAGICPDCGANLNSESCDCAQERARAQAEFDAQKNPFAKLKELDLSQE